MVDREENHLISRSLGTEGKPLSSSPGTGAISQAETAPQPASSGCDRAQVALGSPIKLPPPVNGTEAKLC